VKFRINNIFFHKTPFHFLLIALSILAFSCSKDPIRETPVDPDPDPDSTTTYENGVFVINEGNFNWGNASVSFIDEKNQTVIQDIFRKANDRSLGDVAQSMAILKNTGLIVVNNSNKVEVVSLKDFKSIGSISGFSSPRYIEIIDSSKAYVTNMQNNVSVIDLKNLTITKTIPTQNWTEGMIRYDRFVFVASLGKFNEPNYKRNAQILIIDTKEDRVVDSIQSGKEPTSIVIDKKDKIWVLCTGGYDNFEPASILRINPETRDVEKIFVFPGMQDTPSKLCINPAGDMLYYLKGGIYQLPVTASELEQQPMIPSDGRLFYGLSIHPETGDIFVSDAVDYVQDGKVYRYDPVSGALIKSYNAGRIPGAFCFTSDL
jgi:hypothetical protein